MMYHDISRELSIIIGLLTLIATVIGLYFAYKQVNQSREIKLEAKYELLFLSVVGKHVATDIALKIMNLGRRDITIEEWGVELKNKIRLAVLPRHLALSTGDNLPVEIHPDKTATLHANIVSLRDSLETYIAQGSLKENSKLCIYVRDNFSKIYKTKTAITYRSLVEYSNLLNK